jgi:flagellar motor switch/type III secretory pathway protein FliN
MTTPARHRRLRLSLGTAWVAPGEAAAMGAGNVIALDAAPDDMVDVQVDGHVYARGLPVLVEGRLAVRITEILAPAPRAEMAETQ